MSDSSALSPQAPSLQRILDNIPDIVVQLSPDTLIEFVNSAAQTTLGHTPASLRGRNVLEFIHPDDHEQMLVSLQAGFQSGTSRMEFRARHANGHYVWLEATNRHLLTPGGAAESLILVLREITERREAEQALYSRQKYYRALIENTSDLITVVDTAGIIRYQSPASEHSLGYAPEDLIGQNAFEMIHPEDSRKLLEQFQRLSQPGSSVQASPIEVRAQHRDGSWRIFEVTASDLMTLGVVEGIVATARDITERKQIERAEREQRELADALRHTAAVISGSLELDEVFDRILATVGRVVPHEMSSILLIEGEMARIAHYRDTLGMDWPVDPRTLRYAIASQPALERMRARPRAEIIRDTATSPEWIAGPGFGWIRSSITSPIQALGKVIGFLRLDSGLPDFFMEKHTERLMAFADQAAIAIENARLFENLDVEKQRLELLYELSQNLAASLDLFEVSTRALDLVTHRLGALQGELFFVTPDSDDLALVALSQHDAASVVALNQKLGLKRGQGLAGWVMETRQPAIVPDTRTDPHWQFVEDMDEHVRSVISVPLLAGDELVGVLNIVSEHVDFFSNADIPLLTAVSTPMALALQNARLFQEHTQALAREQRLNAIARAINSTLDLPTILHEMLGLAIEITGAEAAALGLVVDGAIVVQSEHVVNLPGALTFPSAPPTASLSWQVVESRRPLIIRDYARHPLAIPPLIQAGVQETLGVPVTAGDTCLGVIGLYHIRTGRHFVERDMAMAESVGLQAGIAIQNARLFEERTQALAREQRLNEVARIISGTLDLPTILRDVVRLATELIGAEAGALSLVEGDELVIQTEAAVNFPEDALARRIRRDASVLSWEVIEAGQAMLIRDYAHHTRALPNLITAGVREVIAVPVVYGQQRLGVLALYHLNSDKTFTERDLALAESIGRQAGIAVQNARLFEDAQQRATELAALYRASAPLLHATDLTRLSQQIVTAVSEEFEHAHCSVLLLDDDAQELRPVAQRDRSTSDFASFALRLYGPGLIPAAARSGESIYVADVEKDPRYLRGASSTVSELVLPLRAGNKVIGVLNLESNKPDAFSARERRVLETFAERAGLALQNAQLFTATQQNALHLGLLNSITQAAVATRDFDRMLQTLVERVGQVIEADSATITLWDSLRQMAIPGAATYAIRDLYQTNAPLPDEPTITRAVINARRTLIVEDAHTSPLISPRLAAAFPIRSCIGIPLVAGDQILGTTIIAFHQPHHFSLDEVMRSEQAVGQVALGVANGQLLLRLEQARKVAEEASRLKSEFLANTSHELRTPLNGIMGSLKLVLDDLCDTPAEERQFVRTAYDASRRLLLIIDDLLDIAKIEAGKMDVSLQAVDIASAFLDVYSLTQAQAEHKGLQLDIQAPPASTPRAWANAESLRQILLNLVGNALKFTEHGHVRVRTRVDMQERQMHILVEDTGIGIAPEAQARLFEPFVQADGSTTRRYGGTGLGLSISRRLAELMNGNLTLYSAGENQGSTFTLTLPLAPRRE